MRQAKAILFILLIAKSTFGMGLMSTIKAVSGISCHAETSIETIEIDTNSKSDLIEDYENQESDDKGCCENGVCECVCCGHIFTTKINPKADKTYTTSPVKHDHMYKEIYLYNGINHIWQPPQIFNKSY